jgi:hypothetical protein
MQPLSIFPWTLLQHTTIQLRPDLPPTAVDGNPASRRGLLNMCTLILYYKLLENYPIVVANRDEQYSVRHLRPM